MCPANNSSNDFEWGMVPAEIVEKILEYKKSGKVLDLGCGYGRNAYFLAKNGFEVEGVDASEEEIKKLAELGEKTNIVVKSKVCEISQYNYSNSFDAIISINALHFLEEDKVKKVIGEMKTNTNYGGINALAAFTEDNPQKGFPYLFKKNELREIYSDWEILVYEEKMTPLERHGGGDWHRHGLVLIIARKN